MKKWIASFMMFVLLGACVAQSRIQPHVVLVAPKADAPIDKRLDAYQQLQPNNYQVTYISYAYGGGRTDIDFSLVNGTVIHHPQDLLTVVLPNSETAHQIQNYQLYQRHGSLWSLLGVASFFVLAPSFLGSGFAEESGTLPKVLISSASFGVMMVSIGGVFVATIKKTHSRDAAFFSYDASLQEYLNLCHSKKKLIGCEEKALTQPKSAPTSQPQVSASQPQNPTSQP